MSVPGNSCRTSKCAPIPSSGCLFRLPGNCVYYSGSAISSPVINTGEDLNSIIQKLAQSSTAVTETQILYFRVGDGGSLTPVAGSSTFNPSGNPLIDKTVIAVFGGGLIVSPTANAATGDLSWGFVSATGVLTLTNGTFDNDTVYSIWYK